MAKKNIEPDELITSHIPKNFKYYYHIKDERLRFYKRLFPIPHH
jgi:hypothetical protein